MRKRQERSRGGSTRGRRQRSKEPSEASEDWKRREHGGFSNYAGGGKRDIPRDYWGRKLEMGGDIDRDRVWGDRQFGDRPIDDERGPHYGKGPKGYKRSDERIREEVCEAIARQGYVDASDVEVKVEKGVVILSGTVRDRAEKRALEQIAEEVYGVEDVQNEIRLPRREGDGEPSGKRRARPGGRNARA